MASGNADRNLLFGILALQMDFIGRDALIQAMHAWVLDKARPLGQILVEQHALSAELRALLEPLVQMHLAQHGHDTPQSLAALSSVAGVRQQLQQIADPDLQASLAQVPGEGPPKDSWATLAGSVGAPTSAGLRFRVLRPHAEGGLGQVSVALDEELHREVALKEIQERFADDPSNRARFVLEAEITGALEHPSIVPVYGLGTHPDGRPYYAMRFVRGDSLKDALERFHQAEGPQRDPGERRLQLRGLLGRFVAVCNAVAYAHSRGVLHRDLKPGNVMLGNYGETLVVDWGLAKALQPESVTSPQEGWVTPAAGSDVALTRMGTALGTPEYMSPEQAAGRLDQLGPATDVYSLGATLYCLLTSRAPFVRGEGDILPRVQRGQFPAPRQVKKEVPPALQAVCLKAMALKPEERYASPRALADDIEHWLADEPVSAYREPWRVRFARWRRRNRALVTGATVLLVTAVAALTAGLILLGRKQAEVVQQRNFARRARDKAEAINKFLVEDLLAAARPEGLGKDMPMRKVLDRAAQKVETAFPDQPEVEAAVRLAIGDSYRSLSLYKESEKHLRRALELSREHLGPDDPESLKVVDSLVVLLTASNKLAEAEPLGRDNLEARRRILGPEHEDTLTSLQNWAYLLQRQWKYAEAEQLYRDCLETQQRVLGPEHPSTLYTTFLLAQDLYNWGKLDEAEPLFRQVLEANRRVLGPEHPQTLYSLNDLALVLQDRNKLDEAEKQFRQTLEIGRRVWGAEHQETLTVTDNLAVLLRKRGKLEEAEQFQRQAVEGYRRILGAENRQTLFSMRNLAELLSELSKYDEAEELYRQRVETNRRSRGPEHRDTLLSLTDLAWYLQQRGRLEESERLYRQILETQRRVLGLENHDTLRSMNDLALLLRDRHKLDEAEQLLRQVLEVRRRVSGPDHSETLIPMWNLVSVLKNQRKLDEAERLCRDLVETRRRVLGPEHPDTLDVLSWLAGLFKDQGKLAESERLLRQIVETRRRIQGPEHPATLQEMYELGVDLEEQGKFSEAETLLRQVLEVRRRLSGPEHDMTLRAMNWLASVLKDQGKLDEAEPLCRQVLDVRRRTLGPEHDFTLTAMNQLASLLEDQGKLDEAERAYRDVLRLRRKNLPVGHRDLAPTLAGLGGVLTAKRQAKEAEALLREALQIRQKTLYKGHWRTADAESLLGDCLSALGRYAEAEPLLLGSYEKLKDVQGRRMREALDRIVKLYEAWGKPEKAAEWRAKRDKSAKPGDK
jgi:tetratricopeptide (TPR) repeat protein